MKTVGSFIDTGRMLTVQTASVQNYNRNYSYIRLLILDKSSYCRNRTTPVMICNHPVPFLHILSYSYPCSMIKEVDQSETSVRVGRTEIQLTASELR